MNKLEFKLDELNKHLNQLKRNIDYLRAFYGFPLTDKNIEIILKSSDIDKLDSIAYRLIKFQDSLGRAIKLFFSLAEENTDSLTMIDLINLAQKVGFSIDVKLWREIRYLINMITHEYVENTDEIAKAINLLEKEFCIFEKIFKELKEKSENLKNRSDF